MEIESQNLIKSWAHTLQNQPKGERLIVAQAVEELKSQGFNKNETRDLLDAQRKYAHSTIDDAINEAFGVVNKKEIVEPKIAMVCPNSYREVVSFVEHELFNNTPKEFINLLAGSEDPILRVSSKNLNSWYRLAENAQKDVHARTMLHEELKPWVEEAIYSSVLSSRQLSDKIKPENDISRFTFASKDENYQVDLSKGECTCSKFTKSNFGNFGLACEHIIKISEQFNPMQRLKRAVLL